MINELLACADPAREALRVAVFTRAPHDDENVNVHVRHLKRCPFVEVVASVRLSDGPHPVSPGAVDAGTATEARGASDVDDPVLRLYTVWDEWRNRDAPRTPAFSGSTGPRSAVEWVRDLQLPGSTAAIESLASQFRAREVDVILAPGSVELPPDVVAAAKHGVWTLRYGEPSEKPQRHSVLRDFVDGRPVTQAWLRAERGPGQPGLCIGRVNVPVTGGLSAARIIRSLDASASLLPLYGLRRLQAVGWDGVLADASCTAQPIASPGDADGSGQRLLPFLARRVLKSAKQRVARPPGKRWRVYARSTTRSRPWSGPWDDLHEVPAPPGTFIADPMLIDRNGQSWLFVEKYDPLQRKGSIIATQLGPDGMPAQWMPILDLPYHLSFPFVFESQGQLYMIPESAQGRRVDLYRADRFPDRWVLERTLWNHPAWDTVLHVGDDGTHYFLCTLRDPQQSVGHLFLFMAPDLYSAWTMHPSSPVSVDCRYSRNAGPLVEIEGHLYRVAQDPVPHYGSRMHFFRIEALTTAAYRERYVGTREPPAEPGVLGTHAYSRGSRWEVFDWLVRDDAGRR